MIQVDSKISYITCHQIMSVISFKELILKLESYWIIPCLIFPVKDPLIENTLLLNNPWRSPSQNYEVYQQGVQYHMQTCPAIPQWTYCVVAI